MEFEAIILAGGNSMRMGVDKGLIKVEGRTMVEHIIDTLEPIASLSKISTSNWDYEQFGIPLLADDIKGIGPLGGIHSGIKKSLKEFVIVVSVDAPFVTIECLNHLIKNVSGDAVVVSKCVGKVYPLIAIYPKSILRKLESYIKSGKRSVFGFLETQNVVEVEFAEEYQKCFTNINTPEDLEEIEK